MRIHHTKKQSDKEREASREGRLSNRKGKEFEREMVRLFKECLPECFQVQRMIQARGGGGLPDVEIRLNGDPLLHLEAKHGKQPNIRKALEQATHDAHNGAIPAAITRMDTDERDERGHFTANDTLVTLEVDDFIRLLNGLDTETQKEGKNV